MNTSQHLSSPLALELSDISQQFSARSQSPVLAVNRVSLQVRRGEILALLGPNGAGKTSLIDVVLGLAQPTGGSVNIFGMTPQQATSQGLVGMVFQTGGFAQDLTVHDTLRMISAAHNNPQPLDQVIEQCNLRSLLKQKVGKCSGGEQQRVRLALALLPCPDLLILDEPTSGMDVTARHHFWETMRTQAGAGKTILFATHYLEEAQNFAERVVIMNAGEVIADGTPEEIRSVTGVRNIEFSLETGTLQPNDVAQFNLHNFAVNQGKYVLRCVEAESLVKHLLNHYPVKQLEVTSPSLDESFIHLTEGR